VSAHGKLATKRFGNRTQKLTAHWISRFRWSKSCNLLPPEDRVLLTVTPCYIMYYVPASWYTRGVGPACRQTDYCHISHCLYNNNNNNNPHQNKSSLTSAKTDVGKTTSVYITSPKRRRSVYMYM